MKTETLGHIVQVEHVTPSSPKAGHCQPLCNVSKTFEEPVNPKFLHLDTEGNEVVEDEDGLLWVGIKGELEEGLIGIWEWVQL